MLSVFGRMSIWPRTKIKKQEIKKIWYLWIWSCINLHLIDCPKYLYSDMSFYRFNWVSWADRCWQIQICTKCFKQQSTEGCRGKSKSSFPYHQNYWILRSTWNTIEGSQRRRAFSLNKTDCNDGVFKAALRLRVEAADKQTSDLFSGSPQRFIFKLESANSNYIFDGWCHKKANTFRYFPMQILFDTSGWNDWCKSNTAT